MKQSLTKTGNYKLFNRSRENRPVDINRRSNLRKSMEQYGWISAYPMHVVRDDKGNLVIVDGQHRFEIAKELGLSVWYVVTDSSVDVAVINNSQKTWTNSDYAGSFAQRGNKQYERLIAFASEHKISVSCAARLLAGTITFNNVSEAFKNGSWKITDEEFATNVCSILNVFSKYGLNYNNRNMVDSVAACCRVKSFSSQRLIHAVGRCPEKIVRYSTREALLGMLEEIYNYGLGEKSKIPLKFQAENAMRSRNPARKQDEAKKGKVTA